MTNGPTRNDERRESPARHQRLSAEYRLLSIIANIPGSLFWWAEQKQSRLADELEELEWQR
jgi:hypothetical protein